MKERTPEQVQEEFEEAVEGWVHDVLGVYTTDRNQLQMEYLWARLKDKDLSVLDVRSMKNTQKKETDQDRQSHPEDYV